MAKRRTCPETEYNKSFWRRMKDSMWVSFEKYGPVRKGFPFKADAMKTLRLKMAEYDDLDTGGNKDLLVDIANYAMIEYMHPSHPRSHDVQKDGSSGGYMHGGGRATQSNNAGERFDNVGQA